MSDSSFDCIIVGGGHAGSEAACALARSGIKTLLITSNLDRLGYLSCNPAIGGLAKGHMVREIDALGGMMGFWADASGIQFRILNASKGPAVRATRAQIDRDAYQLAVKKTLYTLSNLTLWQDSATELLTDDGRIRGVKTKLGARFLARHVLLTTGTFLEGIIHVGLTHFSAGRMGDAASHGLSDSLRSLGFTVGRLKTGTTPRILKSSIDFSALTEQRGDTPLPRFSFYSSPPSLPQTTCHITWTNEKTHAIIRTGFDRSPLFTGVIQGTGARYCPSIEDKVARFPHHDRHHVFLEPEGLHSHEIYANGISTSLPLDIQIAMLHSIAGLEHAVLLRPGYAIEYDFVDPVQLKGTLESKTVPGLWMAGQINGTSGYEEAAAQGLWAALNIIAQEKCLAPFAPGRDRAYMAVLVDDLVTLGTSEPYRMFTSRAEYRLLLREDNADQRLSPLGRQFGLLNDSAWEAFQKKEEQKEKLRSALATCRIREPKELAGLSPATLLVRTQYDMQAIETLLSEAECAASLGGEDCLATLLESDAQTRFSVETDIKYEGYIARDKALAERSRKLWEIQLPANLDYTKVAGLTLEAVEKLSRVQPSNLGQVSRIPGLTPATISCLEIYIHKLNRSTQNAKKQD
ncbi:MAG: tRNA uridine-5-carboxymethylaminomethyl(34) synthesis enzyme MnmG [Desulfovibrionaceae bacterium]|nr:tRNA uridine-5-carboxymethylaminomethyl(34) synthesis enzyme MnmG [Desulfovibrionaceae bacterium]